MQQMIDNTPGNSQNSKQLDQGWAEQALKDTVAGVLLNAKLVKAGLWHKLIYEMTSDYELEAYGTFIISLRDSHAMARNLEAICLEHEQRRKTNI
jgi:hypothetical protein